MATGLRLVADSSAWIDAFRGVKSSAAAALSHALDYHLVLVPDLVVAEVLRGAKSDRQAETIEKRLRHHFIANAGGVENCVKAASNFRRLRAKGVTIRGTVDLLIGTWCIENNVALLHADRDFDAMAQHLGLRIYDGQ